MWRIIGALWIAALLCPAAFGATGADDSQTFRAKLNEMLSRTETSLKILREQITSNPSAPFLPDLQFELANLLGQKANTLYYLYMESQSKDAETPILATKELLPVVGAQKEAIRVYQSILADYPRFDKRAKVYYLLCLSLKAIDEIPAFLATAQRLSAEFPSTQEDARARLLVGQHLFERQDFEGAAKLLDPVLRVSWPYERNLARYRIGLIQLTRDKHADALRFFESVVSDASLKEEDNPFTVSLKSKGTKSDLKREALIDSVRAYPYVFKENADPVGYYSRLAPTEGHFQETIEKLAYRYIFLKKYTEAIKLLRTLSERLSDPERVVNIYHDVLLMIPVQERSGIPPAEIEFILTKLAAWHEYYVLSPKIKNESRAFFETQTRELGLRAHTTGRDMARTNPALARAALERARSLYLLYLGFFVERPEREQVATNLADVYVLLGNSLDAGEYYLRVFSGEFGKPARKAEAITKALANLEREENYSFYNQTRARGLLIRAIEGYLAFDPRQRRNDKLVFLRAKTLFEQALYTTALNDLFEFMRQFPKSPLAPAAGELVLDFHNKRQDFFAMERSASRMLALNIPNPDFSKRVKVILEQARSKRLHEQVKNLAEYDDFSQGRSYLKAAMSIDDPALRSAALSEALAKSRSERDIETFFRSAAVMIQREKNPRDKAAMHYSLAREAIGVGRFAEARKQFRMILRLTGVDAGTRVKALEECVGLALAMRDWDSLSEYARMPDWQRLSPEARGRVTQGLGDFLESPHRVPTSMDFLVEQSLSSDAVVVGLYKGYSRLSPSLKARAQEVVQARCQEGAAVSGVCHWRRLRNLTARQEAFIGRLQGASLALSSVEALAPEFQALLGEYGQIQDGRDPHRDIVALAFSRQILMAFAEFLQRVAGQEPELKDVLTQKARESAQMAQQAAKNCAAIVARAAVSTPANAFCASPKLRFEDALTWDRALDLPAPGEDPKSPATLAIQKQLFANPKDTEAQLRLSRAYLDAKAWSHASAAALYGLSRGQESEGSFRTVLGCAVLRMGFYSEARYHLSKGNSLGGLREACLKQTP